MLPWSNWQNHLFASEFEIVIDPGPSYMIINLGIFITLVLYVIFFKLLKNIFGTPIPFIILAIFLAIDLKFRSLYILMPTLWLILNHVNYVNQRKSMKEVRYEITLLYY